MWIIMSTRATIRLRKGNRGSVARSTTTHKSTESECQCSQAGGPTYTDTQLLASHQNSHVHMHIHTHTHIYIYTYTRGMADTISPIRILEKIWANTRIDVLDPSINEGQAELCTFCINTSRIIVQMSAKLFAKAYQLVGNFLESKCF